MSDVINVKIIGDLAYVNGVTDAAKKAATDAKQAATDAENFLAQMKVLPADLEILNQGNSLGTGIDSINFKGSGVVASKLQDGVFEVTVTASGGGSSDSAEDIRDKLESLAAGQRLDADHIDETTNRKFMSDLDKAKMNKVVTHTSQSPVDDHVAVWTGGELKAGPSMDGGASSLVKLDGTGKLPAIDGSQLINLPLVDYSVRDVKFEGNNIVFDFNDGSRVVLNNAKLDLKGDKGDAGAKGDTGDKGDTGPAGADGVGGYADKGALGAGDNPQTMESGFYYVTEKFVGAPTITSSYVGHMMIQDKIDDPNGRLLVYFTSAGIYYQQKFAGGWENWLSTATAGFRPTAPVRAFTKFAGIYQNLSELTALVTNPQTGEQAILLDPDDAYFQYSNGSWSKLASVSDVHELYLGIFATQSELDSNHASPDEGSLAIVGDGFKYFTGGKWVDYENHDIVGLTARVNTAEGHLQTLQQDNLKQDGEIKTLQDDKIEGVSVGDGVSSSAATKRLTFNGHKVFPGDQSGEVDIHLSYAHFKTIADRDDWSTRYGAIINFDVISLVDADDNGFVAWYKFDSQAKEWEDYDAQGVVMSDSNGAIPKNIKTVVFGPGFDVQQAGDQEDAALVTFTEGGGSGIDGIVIDGHKVDEFDLGPNLQLDNPSASPRLLVNPRSFENQHAASCLLQLDSDVTVQSGHATKLYTSHEVIPTGEYFSLNQIAHGVNVQDNTGGDTAVTGGELTRIMASVGFYGDKATDDCKVKIWVWYKDPASPLAGGILSDVNGKPMIVERSYNAGDVIREPLIITGAMMATGNAPIVLYIEASAGSWVINPDQTLICLEQFTDGFETSLASIEFERRIGVEINAEIKQFKTKMLSMKEELLGVDEPEATISAHTGYDYLNEFGVQNLTAIKASIAGGVLQIKDNGVPADTYVDVYLDNAKTTMLRDKVIDYDVTIANPQDAWRLELYKWTGKADRAGRVYDSRNNGALNLNDGFELVKSKFIAENADGSFKGYLDTATVPDDAVNLFIILRPVDEQDPIDLSMKDFTWGVANPFRGYAEVSQHNLHESHLKFSENWAEFYLNNQGYPSIRYTINNTPSSGNPMPVGILGKGRAPVEIDTTVNQVGGSADPQNDGAIKFLKDGEASISKSYNLRNEQSTENTVTFWDVLIDIDGNETKIDDSELTVKVPANTGKPGVIYSIPAYVVEVETGQRVGGRALSNKADGAYVQSDNITEYIVQTEIDFKELVADSSDTTDLVNAPIPKANAFDRRVYSFTGNAQQNIVIDIDIPADVELAEIEAIKISGTTRTSIKECEYSYDSSTKKLTVHVGNGVADGRIHLTFWSGIA